MHNSVYYDKICCTLVFSFLWVVVVDVDVDVAVDVDVDGGVLDIKYPITFVCCKFLFGS